MILSFELLHLLLRCYYLQTVLAEVEVQTTNTAAARQRIHMTQSALPAASWFRIVTRLSHVRPTSRSVSSVMVSA